MEKEKDIDKHRIKQSSDTLKQTGISVSTVYGNGKSPDNPKKAPESTIQNKTKTSIELDTSSNGEQAKAAEDLLPRNDLTEIMAIIDRFKTVTGRKLLDAVYELDINKSKTKQIFSEAEVLVIQQRLTQLRPAQRCFQNTLFADQKKKMPDGSRIPMFPFNAEIVAQFWMTGQCPSEWSENKSPGIFAPIPTLADRIVLSRFAVLTPETLESTETSDYEYAQLNAGSPTKIVRLSTDFGKKLSKKDILSMQSFLYYLSPPLCWLFYIFHVIDERRMPDGSPVPVLPFDGKIVERFWIRQVPLKYFRKKIPETSVSTVSGNGELANCTQDVLKSAETNDFKWTKSDSNNSQTWKILSEADILTLQEELEDLEPDFRRLAFGFIELERPPFEGKGLSAFLASGNGKSPNCTQIVPKPTDIETNKFKGEVSYIDSSKQIRGISDFAVSDNGKSSDYIPVTPKPATMYSGREVTVTNKMAPTVNEQKKVNASVELKTTPTTSKPSQLLDIIASNSLPDSPIAHETNKFDWMLNPNKSKKLHSLIQEFEAHCWRNRQNTSPNNEDHQQKILELVERFSGDESCSLEDFVSACKGMYAEFKDKTGSNILNLLEALSAYFPKIKKELTTKVEEKSEDTGTKSNSRKKQQKLQRDDSPMRVRQIPCQKTNVTNPVQLELCNRCFENVAIAQNALKQLNDYEKRANEHEKLSAQVLQTQNQLASEISNRKKISEHLRKERLEKEIEAKKAKKYEEKANSFDKQQAKMKEMEKKMKEMEKRTVSLKELNEREEDIKEKEDTLKKLKITKNEQYTEIQKLKDKICRLEQQCEANKRTFINLNDALKNEKKQLEKENAKLISKNHSLEECNEDIIRNYQNVVDQNAKLKHNNLLHSNSSSQASSSSSSPLGDALIDSQYSTEAEDHECLTCWEKTSGQAIIQCGTCNAGYHMKCQKTWSDTERKYHPNIGFLGTCGACRSDIQ